VLCDANDQVDTINLFYILHFLYFKHECHVSDRVDTKRENKENNFLILFILIFIISKIYFNFYSNLNIFLF